MNRLVTAMVAGLALLLAMGATAGDEGAAAKGPSEKSRDGGAQRAEAMAKMFEAEKAKLAEEAARVAANPELLAAVQACQKALSGLTDHAKIITEAMQAGAKDRMAQLEADGKALHAGFNRTKNSLSLLRSAAECRKQAEGLGASPAAPEAAGARNKLAASMKALGDFYTEQARGASNERGGLTAEAQAAEIRLKSQRERDRIEYEYQQGMAATKSRMEKATADPEVQGKMGALTEKSAALRDAQLKLLDAQEAMQQAQAARKLAEQALSEAASQRKPEAKPKEGAPAAPAPK